MFLKFITMMSTLYTILATPYTPPVPIPCTNTPTIVPTEPMIDLTLPPQGPPRDVPLEPNTCMVAKGLKCNLCANTTSYTFNSGILQYQLCMFEFKYLVQGYLPLTLGIQVDSKRWVIATCTDKGQDKPVLSNINGDVLTNVLSIGETKCGDNSIEVDLYFPGFEWFKSGVKIPHFLNDHNFTIQL